MIIGVYVTKVEEVKHFDATSYNVYITSYNIYKFDVNGISCFSFIMLTCNSGHSWLIIFHLLQVNFWLVFSSHIAASWDI